MCVEALGSLQSLHPSATSIYIGGTFFHSLISKPSANSTRRGVLTSIFIKEELRSLHLGQGYDIHWSHASVIPSEEDYIKMCDASKKEPDRN